MEGLNSPSPPRTLTVRRNPPRRAKTPAVNTTVTPKPTPTPKASKSAPKRKEISAFPLQEILECQVVPTSTSTPLISNPAENLRVFLRIKPLITSATTTTTLNKKGDVSRAKPNLPAKKKPMVKKAEVETSCLVVNDSHSVTLSPPPHMQDAKRLKSEVYDGFTHVFDSDSSQNQVYEQVMEPLVSEFLKGKSGMLTALGPTGSGKTHTIFGTPRQPGMLSLALENIFVSSSSSYYISMFEIYSEREKGERLIDLSSSDGPDLILQQSTVKGLQEVLVSSVVEAEAMIARGMLKRTTASTNSNSQSSRSQCIINIRGATEVVDSESETLLNNPVLTIVDLAGAEREKKTGNQGTKLLQSNFINNTSMVFGLCLRSLLEHQKNPKKPLQKHFQNSLLTKYLRDYLEGRKRMALILTVKSGGKDYLDASLLLRQASPYMKIKFSIVEEPYQKRNISKVPREDKSKKRKLSEPKALLVYESLNSKDEHPSPVTDPISPPLQQLESPNVSSSSKRVELERKESTQSEDYCAELMKLKRNEEVLQKFSKALWTVLKQYKNKFEVNVLRTTLDGEKARCVELENEIDELKSHTLNSEQHSKEAFSGTESKNEVNVLRTTLDGEKARRVELENEIKELKSHALNSTQHSKEAFSGTQAETSGTVPDCSNLSMNDHEPNQAQASSNFQVLPDEETNSLNLSNAKKSDSTNSSPCSKLIVEEPRLRVSTSSKLLEVTNDLNLDVDTGRAKAQQVSIGTCSVASIDSENLPSCKSLDEKKPRRRLLPASSVLLREVNNFELEDEAERPLGGKGGRKVDVPERGRTQGSISLLKMLKDLRV